MNYNETEVAMIDEPTGTHTPGPWRYDRPKHDGYAEHSYVWGPEVSIETSGDVDECEPDMLLIAAAPEMLQALKNAVSALKIVNIFINSCFSIEVVREAESIIAKAEGKDRG